MNKITVYCVYCHDSLGQMSMDDIALNCREICLECYDRLLELASKYEGLCK